MTGGSVRVQRASSKEMTHYMTKVVHILCIAVLHVYFIPLCFFYLVVWYQKTRSKEKIKSEMFKNVHFFIAIEYLCKGELFRASYKFFFYKRSINKSRMSWCCDSWLIVAIIITASLMVCVALLLFYDFTALCYQDTANNTMVGL